MRFYEWERLKEEDRLKQEARFGPPPPTTEEKVKAIRKELDSLKGRLKDEVLAELRSEVERLISAYQKSPSERIRSHDLSE
ncbi:MAG: hypothetical protein ACRDFQ_00355 [Anaerolineales bacterium]